jgi:ppGpp synthetase/RelA/SpoT-type nucleotidyltranferase
VGAVQQTATNLIEGNAWYEGVAQNAIVGAIGGAVAGRVVGALSPESLLPVKMLVGGVTGGGVSAGTQVAFNVAGGRPWNEGVGAAFGMGFANGAIDAFTDHYGDMVVEGRLSAWMAGGAAGAADVGGWRRPGGVDADGRPNKLRDAWDWLRGVPGDEQGSIRLGPAGEEGDADWQARQAAKEAVRNALGDEYPELANVVGRLIDDTEHRLNLVEALKDPTHRPRTLELLKEMAAGRTLAGQALEDFLQTYPGRGPLFEKMSGDVYVDAAGRSRKQLFVERLKDQDPSLRVGETLGELERMQVEDYAWRLQYEVEPTVRREIASLTDLINERFGSGATYNVRTKDAEALIDKVNRMVGGSAGRSPRPDYQVGDVIDAVGARITVEDTTQLAVLLEEVKTRFGTGPGGRILEVENMYASPKPHAPAYRVIPMIISTEVNGRQYTFELQLTTRRASTAADLGHNTIYKPSVETTASERDAILRAQEEAAALEQIESRAWR